MIEGQWFCHFAADFQCPWIGFQATSISGGIGFIQPEFIEVVITGDFICWRQWQVILPGGRLAELQRFSGGGGWAIIPFKPAKQIGMRSVRQRKCSRADAQCF
ncbi:hypothetical protein QDX85_09045 [Escherichia coli]|nr:hypothetical protein QDX85_09045 [Escherichia coli]